jgi:hypothetical protein
VSRSGLAVSRSGLAVSRRGRRERRRIMSIFPMAERHRRVPLVSGAFRSPRARLPTWEGTQIKPLMLLV